MRLLKLAALLQLCLAAPVFAQLPAGVTWGPAPSIFPAGAKLAVLQGDPGKPALFTVRLQMPDGYVIPPHFHPTDEHITVIQGTFLVGMGDKADFSKSMALAPGGFVTAGVNMHHFAQAKGVTVVQVSAIGPFVLTYVNPADDPTRTARR